MRKLVALFVGLTFVAVAPIAMAKDVDGMKALGAASTGNGAMLSWKQWMSGGMGWQAMVGFQMNAAANNAVAPNDETEMVIDLGFRILKGWQAAEMANLTAFGGVNLDMNSNAGNVKDAGATNIWIGAGFSPEVWILDNVSVEFPMGLQVQMFGETASGADNAHMDISTYASGVSIVGGGVFHYYWQ